MRQKSYIVLLLFIILTSCGNSERAKRMRIEEEVNAWYGKQIEWTDNLQWKIMAKDTLITDISAEPCKVLVYVDSAGCNDCRLQPLEWKDFQDSLRARGDIVAPMFFIFQTTDETMLRDMFARFDLRVLYALDRGNKFRQTNNFSGEGTVNVFLLDERDRVELVGTPLFQPKLWALYQKQIINRLHP